MRTAIRELAVDLLFLGGIVGLVFGAWQAYPPAAYIVGGMCALALGVLLSRDGPTSRPEETPRE